MYKLLYFCMAAGILLFSVIVVNIAPAINKLVGTSWSQDSCKFYADRYKNYKDTTKPVEGLRTQEEIDAQLHEYKTDKTNCERKQAMVGLEYASLNCNLIFGFICALLGFFLFFNIGDVGKIASFAGLGAGIVGFVLTFVYVIESGLVFNGVSDISFPRIDSDGVWAEWDGSKYKCKYLKEKKPESFFIRYSDLGNKFFRYNKDIKFGEKYKVMEKCKDDDSDKCSDNAQKTYTDDNGETKKCDKLYYYYDTNDNTTKIIYDRWLTTIILSCFIFILDIGLALFGFLVNSGSKETGL